MRDGGEGRRQHVDVAGAGRAREAGKDRGNCALYAELGAPTPPPASSRAPEPLYPEDALRRQLQGSLFL